MLGSSAQDDAKVYLNNLPSSIDLDPYPRHVRFINNREMRQFEAQPGPEFSIGRDVGVVAVGREVPS
jgi:hypothetical protein